MTIPLLLTLGCGTDGVKSTADSAAHGDSAGACDMDRDGHEALTCGGDDCDDHDPAAYTGAPDACGDADDCDCDGVAERCAWESGTLADADAVLLGETPLDLTGSNVALGDFDGDGLADAVVEATAADGNMGALFIKAAPVRGAIALAEDAVRWRGTGEEMGALVVADFNDDGRQDILVGAHKLPSYYGDDYAGGAYIFTNPIVGGSTSAATATLRDCCTGSINYLRTGDAVAVGDLDGDGGSDAIVSSPITETYRGRIYVVPGAAAGDLEIQEASSSWIDGEDALSNAGDALAVADMDGDASDDLVVCASGYESRGAIYVLSGPVTSGSVSLADADSRVMGLEEGDLLGCAVAVGDANADGVPDVLVAGKEAPFDGRNEVGQAWLLDGPLTSGADLGAASMVLTGSGTYQWVGSSVALADINADGAVDVAVGDDGWASYDVGAVHIMFSPRGGSIPVDDADATLSGAAAYDRAGTSMAVGDADGDGVDDLLIGGEGFGGPGTAWLVLGGSEY